MNKNTELFTDFPLYGGTGRPYLVNDEALYQAIYNVLHTFPKERTFRESFGVGVDSSIFTLMNSHDTYLLGNKIKNAIKLAEGANIVDVAVAVSYGPENNSMSFDIDVRLPDMYPVKRSFVFDKNGEIISA
jgi:hypothetical protein